VTIVRQVELRAPTLTLGVHLGHERAHQALGLLNTSCTISGWRAITASNVRAGPSGVRRPCSQSRTVATLSPNTCAKLACVRPSRLRIGSTSTLLGGWYSRTGRSTSPRAQATASEKLSISASPTAGLRRFFAVFARLVTVALHELVAKLAQEFLLRGVDVLLHVLRVDVQQQDERLARPMEVDRPRAAALAHAGPRDARLAQPPRARDDRPVLGSAAMASSKDLRSASENSFAAWRR